MSQKKKSNLKNQITLLYKPSIPIEPLQPIINLNKHS